MARSTREPPPRAAARPGSLRSRAVGLALLPALVCGCSQLTRLSAGPAASFEGGRGAAWGGGVVAETSGGVTAPGGTFTAVGAGARGAATPRALEVAPFVGAYAGSSVDRVFLDGSVRLGPGLQRTEGATLGFASLGASTSVGYPLSDTGWRPRPSALERWHDGAPRVPLGGPDALALDRAEAARRGAERERSRVLLTLTLAADVDVRFTRAPTASLGLLLGVAWLDQVTRPE
ncbi:MAG: hypothetical protein JNL38_32330 [Myxococcales bacterium]|nr:hypothetical protein [Myxococcales bacterium]